MSTIRVVHYLNQFFVGLGAEAHAGTGPGKKAGAVGPGIALQQALGEGAQVVATVYCGDNYANEQANAIDAILELVSERAAGHLDRGPGLRLRAVRAGVRRAVRTGAGRAGHRGRDRHAPGQSGRRPVPQ